MGRCTECGEGSSQLLPSPLSVNCVVDLDLAHAQTAPQKDLILSAQADAFFTNGRYMQAAQTYAQTNSKSFEEVVLRFVDAEERDALRVYLSERLAGLRKGVSAPLRPTA